MASNRYLDQHRSHADIMLDHLEIEKAIHQATGEMIPDKKIEEIWEKVLKR
ncbi:MAG: hypothetical protein ACYC54_15600 [Sedimentisphaerales bacterium]